MASWLESLQTQIAEIRGDQLSFAEPDGDPCPHDHVVGAINEHLQRLFFLKKQNMRRAYELVAELALCPIAERAQKTAEAERHNSVADLLDHIFWMSCRHAFPEIQDKPSIGVRKGWLLVWTEEHKKQGLEVIFGGLLGPTSETMSSSPTPKKRTQH